MGGTVSSGCRIRGSPITGYEGWDSQTLGTLRREAAGAGATEGLDTNVQLSTRP